MAAALGVPLRKRFTYNTAAGVAGALLYIRPWQQRAVVEVGIEDVGQMEPMARLARPDIAVVTGIGSEHHNSLKTLDVTRHEKAYLVRPQPVGHEPMVLRIDWVGIKERGDTTTNYQILPGDRVVVPGGKAPSLLQSLLGGA